VAPIGRLFGRGAKKPNVPASIRQSGARGAAFHHCQRLSRLGVSGSLTAVFAPEMGVERAVAMVQVCLTIMQPWVYENVFGARLLMQ
jgi:hypothetical protein